MFQPVANTHCCSEATAKLLQLGTTALGSVKYQHFLRGWCMNASLLAVGTRFSSSALGELSLLALLALGNPPYLMDWLRQVMAELAAARAK